MDEEKPLFGSLPCRQVTLFMTKKSCEWSGRGGGVQEEFTEYIIDQCIDY